MMIMNTSVIDWNRLVAQARNRRLILPLRDTLDYLHHRLAARVPPEILQSLHNMQASRLERAEYKYKTENYEAKPLGYLPVLWFRYLRLEGSDRPLHKLLGFVKYLQRFWGADNVRQLPSCAALMGIRKIRSIASSIARSMAKDTLPKTFIHAEANAREIGK